MKQRNRADEGVGSGGVSVKLVEKAQLPGFGFSGQGDTAPCRGEDSAPTKNASCVLKIISSKFPDRCIMDDVKWTSARMV
jgi:hypothetical protein